MPDYPEGKEYLPPLSPNRYVPNPVFPVGCASCQRKDCYVQDLCLTDPAAREQCPGRIPPIHERDALLDHLNSRLG